MPIDPNQIENLRNLKVPSRMVNSQQLKDYVLANAGENATPDIGQLLNLLLASNLEMVGTFGEMEAKLKELQASLQRFRR